MTPLRTTPVLVGCCVGISGTEYYVNSQLLRADIISLSVAADPLKIHTEPLLCLPTKKFTAAQGENFALLR
jgi:hypothetical protein